MLCFLDVEEANAVAAPEKAAGGFHHARFPGEAVELFFGEVGQGF